MGIRPRLIVEFHSRIIREPTGAPDQLLNAVALPEAFGTGFRRVALGGPAIRPSAGARRAHPEADRQAWGSTPTPICAMCFPMRDRAGPTRTGTRYCPAGPTCPTWAATMRCSKTPRPIPTEPLPISSEARSAGTLIPHPMLWRSTQARFAAFWEIHYYIWCGNWMSGMPRFFCSSPIQYTSLLMMCIFPAS